VSARRQCAGPGAGGSERSAGIRPRAHRDDRRFAVTAGGQTLEANTLDTGALKEHKPQAIGQITLPAGECQLAVKSVGALKGALMNFRQIKLTPVDR